MTKWQWGLIYWGGFWFLLAFLPAELWGNSGDAPWPTLSGELQHYAHKYWYVAALLATTVVGVGVHWLFDQKMWPSMFVGASLALSAHFLNNRWP